MPRHDYQPQGGVGVAERQVGLGGEPFLRGLGTAGQKYDVVGGDAGQTAELIDLGGPAIAADAVELHRAGDADIAGTEGREPVGVIVRTGADDRDPAEHGGGEAANPAVSEKALLAHSRIGDHDRDVPPLGRGQEVGPEFQFTEHEQIRADAIEDPMHRPAEVERTGKRPFGAEPSRRHLEAGRRGTRDHRIDPAAVGCGLPLEFRGERGE